MLVLESINHMVVKRSNWTVGVSRKGDKFRGTINIKNIDISDDIKEQYNSTHCQISLGVFKDKYLAFSCINKELLIQESAKSMYKNEKIYKELYETLLNYKINEDD